MTDVREAIAALDRNECAPRAASRLSGHMYTQPVGRITLTEAEWRSPSDAATRAPDDISPSIVSVCIETETDDKLDPELDGNSCIPSELLPVGTYAWSVPPACTVAIRLADGTTIRLAHSEWGSVAITPGDR